MMTTETTEEVSQDQLDADIEAEFAKGFAGRKEVIETPPPPAPEPSAPVDPMDSLPDDVRRALSMLPVLTTKVTELQRTAGQVPHLMSEINRLSKQIPPPAPPPEPVFDKLEALRSPDGLPEVAGAIDQIAKHFRDELTRRDAVKEPPAPEPPPTQTTQQVTVSEDEAALDRDIPDWRPIGGSKEFTDWVAKQADGQDIAKTTSPVKFASAIGRFKAHQQFAAINTQRQARATAAVAPTSTARPATPAEQTIEEAFEAGFNKNKPRR